MADRPPLFVGIDVLAPGAAALILREVLAQCQAGAVIVFDLDSTLLDNRLRQSQIVREYGQEHNLPALLDCQPQNWHGWDIRTPMRELGLSEDVIDAHYEPIRKFWRERFFTSEYCTLDIPIEGAAEYLRAVGKTPVQIWYVTGRHEGMRAGTLECLDRHGFPVPQNRPSTRLHMKPTIEESDDEFKAQTYQALSQAGTVIAAFDNEPTHINGYRDHFTTAKSVHLATDHSMRTVPIKPGVISIANFYL